MQFSHPFSSEPHNDEAQDAPARQGAAYENLFHEPEFAPGTEPAEPFEPAEYDAPQVPSRRQGSGTRNRRRVA